MHTPAQPWRSPRLCEGLISRGIFFLAKPQRALRHAYPQRSLGFSATLREPHFSWDIFSRQAAKGAKACTPPCAAFAFSAPLREPHFPRYIFSRQAAKGAKACTPLRSLCVLRAFARDVFSRGIFFLAKPQRALRHAHPSAQPWRSPRLHALILQPL